MAWRKIKLDQKFFANAPEQTLRGGQAAMENCFINEMKGHSRFPGLKAFAQLNDNSPTYLHQWRDNLIAVTNGQVYEINSQGAARNVTHVPVSGGHRVTFAETPEWLVMAAGKTPIKFGGYRTEVLSSNTPDSTHVGYVEGYLLASEYLSGRFWHSEINTPTIWNDLDVFAADTSSDNIEALMVTPFREVVLGGKRSVEQYERLGTGDVPFFRRWAMGEGIRGPYTMTFANNSVWYVNHLGEFTKSSGQIPRDVSEDIGFRLEQVDSWVDAWVGRVHVRGQKFLLLQLPSATTEYGTKGATYLYDYRNKRWSTLFGWDDGEGVPTRWPGWSTYSLWGRWFVGGNGRVYELDPSVNTNGGQKSRVLARTAHMSDLGEIRVDNVRMRLQRGNTDSNVESPRIALRCRRDDSVWTKAKMKDLGLHGKREPVVEFGGMGCGHTFQFEYWVTDDAPVEVVSMDFDVTPLST